MQYQFKASLLLLVSCGLHQEVWYREKCGTYVTILNPYVIVVCGNGLALINYQILIK